MAEPSLIDAFRIGQSLSRVMVTDVAEEYDKDPCVRLVDITRWDGTTLNGIVAEKRKHFGTTPFDPAGAVFKLYRGGVTIWSGFPGTGKTTLLRQFICQCLYRGSSVFLASLEEHPEDVLVNLAATAAGCEFPTGHQTQWFIDAYAKRFKLWGVIGLAEHREMLAAIRQAAASGTRHAIIDSLMRLDVANDDFEGQRKFANLVAATAQASGVHIHLVAHPRKLVSADQEPDINDVAGARELGGIADNVIFIRRAKAEDKMQRDASPMRVAIRKQRYGSGELGDIAGWYQRPWRQFHVEQVPVAPARYLPADAYT